ncbi:MAG: GNAT family acetyltransferase [Desulfobacteraceae bacterium]|nr:GNAT family acetyltransferase [Desulfobacteraceae bacterium]
MSTTTGDLIIKPYEPDDQQAVIALWIQCGLVVPQNNPEKDIQAKLAFQPGLFLSGFRNDVLVATVMAGYEGHRGWINYLAVAPHCRRQGLGRKMMTHAQMLLAGHGCPKINLQVRHANTQVIEFYRRCGFSDDKVLSMGKRIDTS